MIESTASRTNAVRFKILSDLKSGIRWVVDAEFAAGLEWELAESNKLRHDLNEANAGLLAELAKAQFGNTASPFCK